MFGLLGHEQNICAYCGPMFAAAAAGASVLPWFALVGQLRLFREMLEGNLTASLEVILKWKE